MNCQKCKFEIDERDLRRESLSGAAEAHLGTCASCRVFCEERLALLRLVGELEKFPAPADFDFRIRARMAAEMSARAPRPGWFNFSTAALSWPLAGCLALLISASLYLQQRQTNTLVTLPEETRTLSLRPSVEKARSVSEQAIIVNPRSNSDAPILKTSLPQRQRLFSERSVRNKRGGTAIAHERVEESNSVGVTGAPVRFAATGGPKGESLIIPVQLSAPERPLKVLLRDTSGGARTISVDSVSFGSRDVIGRPATFKNASLPSNQGVW